MHIICIVLLNYHIINFIKIWVYSIHLTKAATANWFRQPLPPKVPINLLNPATRSANWYSIHFMSFLASASRPLTFDDLEITIQGHSILVGYISETGPDRDIVVNISFTGSHMWAFIWHHNPWPLVTLQDNLRPLNFW